ncbi:MAG: hypothetical protein ACRYHA_08215 [Janthinobacterium lividum]
MNDAARLYRRFALAGALVLGGTSVFLLLACLRQQSVDAEHERVVRAGVLAQTLAAQIGAAVTAGVPLERLVDLAEFIAQRRRGDPLLSIAVCDARHRVLAASGALPRASGDEDAPVVATAPVRDMRTGGIVGVLRVSLAAGDVAQRFLAPLAVRLCDLLAVLAAVLGFAGEALREAWSCGPALRRRVVLAGARRLRAEDFSLSWRGAPRRYWDPRAQDNAHLARQVNESERRAWRLVDSLSRTETDAARRAQLDARLAQARGPARFAVQAPAIRCGVATSAQARWLAVLAGCAAGALGTIDGADVADRVGAGTTLWLYLATLLGVAAACRPPIGRPASAAMIGGAGCVGLVWLALCIGSADVSGAFGVSGMSGVSGVSGALGMVAGFIATVLGPTPGVDAGWAASMFAHAAAGVCLGALLGAADSAVRLATRKSRFDMPRAGVRDHWLGACLGLFWFGPVVAALAGPIAGPIVAWIAGAVLPGAVAHGRVARALMPALFAAAAAGLLSRYRGDRRSVDGLHPWQGVMLSPLTSLTWRHRAARGGERRVVLAAALAVGGWCLQATFLTHSDAGPSAFDLSAVGLDAASRGLRGHAPLLLWSAVGLGLLAGARDAAWQRRGAARVLGGAAAGIVVAQAVVLTRVILAAPLAAPGPAWRQDMVVLGLRVLAATGAGLLATLLGRRLATLRAPLAACLPFFCVTLGLTGLGAMGGEAAALRWWGETNAARVALQHAWTPLLAYATALVLLTVPARARRPSPGRADRAD